MNENYYEPKGIIVHMYQPIKNKRFYLTEDGVFSEDKEQALYLIFKDVSEFNLWLEDNIEEVIDTYGDSVRFEKRRRLVKIKN